MKSLFSGYYSFSENELADLWQECTFIVDTNILLNLYRYPKKTSDELLSVLKKVANRLWIPFQVALEYQENRLSVINEQIEMFKKVEDAIEAGKDKLEDGLNQLKLRERHSLIDTTDFLNKINTTIDEFQQELKTLKGKQPNIFEYDKIRDEIDRIFDGKIGSTPNGQEELNAIYEEGKKRYEQKYPPGYMDIDKYKDAVKKGVKTAYLFNGLVFERKYGDLILWHQIIEEAKKNEKLKRIIFVSGDTKEDWWYKVERFGTREKAILGPRPELVQELTTKAGVLQFQMYQTDSFLLDANKYLGTQVSQEIVEQIRDINTASSQTFTLRRNSIQWYYQVIEPIIYEWLQTLYPHARIIANNYFPDFIILDENGYKIGYEIKFTQMKSFHLLQLKKIINHGTEEISQGKFNTLKILLLTDNEDTVRNFEKLNNKLEYPPTITIEVGLVTEHQDGKYIFEKVI
ncbi:MAG TPA: PIN-like domain-containing protein [Nostocaceae cyanobacterium]|nr:PIN-like domain-containing protein [Nostocaceae cyanobacterium]